jgi:hypothetical protein
LNRGVLIPILLILPFFLDGCPQGSSPAVGYGDWKSDPSLADELAKQKTGTNGIEVGSPKFYDDASLRAMLDQTRTRLAAINGFNEAALVGHLGAITGSTSDQTQLAFQVMGPSSPTIAATNNGATSQTTTNNGLPAGQTTLPSSTVVTSNPSQSTVNTTTPTTAALPTIPSSSAYTLPSAMAGSALDLFNEEMQLTYEIANLQLLLEGALSDRFVQNQNIVKPRTTIGFPISLAPQTRYENAVAVVEVEVQNPSPALSDEPPVVATILPREKTYNVAALTDNTTSIGAGAVIHAISISGSWFRSHKTYYLVQDQDTVALERPVEQQAGKPKLTRFAWEFHPVLGQKYVRAGLKQTFVQLSLPVLPAKPCFGSIRIRTYWRRFDQKTGLTGEVISGSALVDKKTFSIPNYNLTPNVDDVEYQDQGDGNLLVRVKGNFLSGTYVQVGSSRFDASKGLLVEESGLSFIAPAAALVRSGGYVVSRGGQRARLVSTEAQDYVEKPDQLSCIPPDEKTAQAVTPSAELKQIKPSADGRTASIEFQKVDTPSIPSKVTLVNELTNEKLGLTNTSSTSFALANPMITANVSGGADVCRMGSIRINKISSAPFGDASTELAMEFESASFFSDEVLLEVGHKIFGLADSPVKRNPNAHTITAIVPTSLVVEGRGVRALRLFWTSPDRYKETGAQSRNECFSSFKAIESFDVDVPAEKLVLVSVNPNGDSKYLLYGNGLTNVRVLSPEHALLTPLDKASADRMTLVSIAKADLTAAKKIVLQKVGGQRPLILDIPAQEPKPPKVTVDSPVILNTDEIEVPVERLDELKSVKMGDKLLKGIKGKGSIRLVNLRADGVTNEQKTRELVFEFNDGTKVTAKVDVVAERVGVK